MKIASLWGQAQIVYYMLILNGNSWVSRKPSQHPKHMSLTTRITCKNAVTHGIWLRIIPRYTSYPNIHSVQTFRLTQVKQTHLKRRHLCHAQHRYTHSMSLCMKNRNVHMLGLFGIGQVGTHEMFGTYAEKEFVIYKSTFHEHVHFSQVTI